jgi:hypothetical protein
LNFVPKVAAILGVTSHYVGFYNHSTIMVNT